MTDGIIPEFLFNIGLHKYFYFRIVTSGVNLV